MRNIAFEGLTFEGTDFTPQINAWYQNAETREGMINMVKTENITIRNSHFKNAGLFGIYMHNYNKYKRAVGCWIEQMDISGILLRADRPGHEFLQYEQQWLYEEQYRLVRESLQDVLGPNGLFFDYNTFGQVFKNIKITDVQSNALAQEFRYNDSDKGYFENASWLPGYDEELIDTAHIGLREDFPIFTYSYEDDR